MVVLPALTVVVISFPVAVHASILQVLSADCMSSLTLSSPPVMTSNRGNRRRWCGDATTMTMILGGKMCSIYQTPEEAPCISYVLLKQRDTKDGADRKHLPSFQSLDWQ